MSFQIFFLSSLLLLGQLSTKASCEDTEESEFTTPPAESGPPPPALSSGYDVTSFFEFSKPLPSNKLGIFPTIMVHIEFKVGQTVSLWRTNTAFATEDILAALAELCDTKKKTIYSENEGDFLHWGNCTFNQNQITALLEQGTGQGWNKNFSYIEVIRKPFIGVGKQDKEKYQCILSIEDYKHKNFYIVLMSNTFAEGGGKVSEPIYKLESFMPFALDFFSDIIDIERIFQFYPMDFINQTPHYKCLTSIAFGDSAENLKKYCKFKCKPLPIKEKGEVKEENVEQKRDEL